MQKLLIYLSIAVVGVGLMVFVSEYVVPVKGKVYKDATLFNEAMQEAIQAGDVPQMPGCAESIELGREGDTVVRIDFICENEEERSAYVLFIKEEYAWHAAAVGEDRVSLQRVTEG